MSSTTFFFAFIPVLAFILLAVNLLFAPHNPYQEKNSAFECGFTSFLGQNRTQFSISFFIFALLFLLFDLEILLVYPYLVSAYTNETYGLMIVLIFLLALTLGFAFELGKKALSIDSRQTGKIKKLPNSHTFVTLPLQSSMFRLSGSFPAMPDISKFKLYVDFLNFGTVDLKGISSLFRQVCSELTTINSQFDDLSSAYYNLISEFDTTGSIILGCAGAIFLGAEIIILLSAT